MFRFVSLLACASLAAAHTVIVYPGWRGNNIHTNGTVSDTDHTVKPGSLGINYEGNDTYGFPYGMQWMYPCGGMPTSTNRTKWPISGGAVSIQPGWFPGHSMAQIYINMGYGTEPQNMSHAMVSGLSIVGPSNFEYNGTFCLPQVPLPANFTPKVGDNATIQVIELAQHGAALYNCADITFAENTDPEIPQVNQSNCFNSSNPGENIGFQLVYTTTSPAPLAIALNPYFSVLAPLMLVAASWITWL
ncbi:hypothetical protein BU23DRAFT_570600 [Bimuria novae-zelandiae CBS 107.79]|uniref:Copper acquisition factor BIM1-like domain-containing protein n=1 Tax=Bimuria novae-zelandiae CBS 107.79 TaxID=1447943 RepID=A0A6A5V0Y8_9PLEO|nr:hypothetical protein BU23DRAFT_570600 [Bimuria novae-zelandiae CBS 107.79]